jgi:hypothetical protein
MSSYDATPVIAAAIKSAVAHPLGSMRFLPDSDEDVALVVIDALEAAGFEIVRSDEESSS